MGVIARSDGRPLLMGGSPRLATVPTVPTALSLMDFPARMVAQRAAGQTRGFVWFRFGYTGSAPAGVEVQVVEAVTGAVVADWSALAGLTCAAGQGVGQAWVPQGGRYRARWRDAANPATVVEGAARWGVGIVVVYAGQSDNLPIWGGIYTGQEAGLYDSNPDYGSMYTDAGWYALSRTFGSAGGTANTASNQSAPNQQTFARQLRAALGGTVPVAFVPRWASGTAFYNLFVAGGEHDAWWTANGGTTQFGLNARQFQNQPDGTYGDWEMFFLSQGGGDAGSPAASSAWRGQLDTFYTRMQGWLSGKRTAAQLLFGVEIIKAADRTQQPYNNVIRQAQLSFVADNKAAGRKVVSFATLTDLPYASVDLSLQTAMDNLLPIARTIQTGLWGIGAASFSGAGATIGIVTRITNGVRLAIVHDGGTSLTDRAGTTTGAITGVTVSLAADLSSPIPGTAHITGGASLDWTATGALPAGTLYVGYLYEAEPAQTNCLYDNAVVAAYNPGPMVPGDSTSYTLGLPVQPMLGIRLVA